MPSAAPADDGDVGQRLVTLAAIVAMAAITAASAPGAAKPLPNWAAPQIATVVAHKLMGATSASRFRPNAALTRQTLANLGAGLKEELAPSDSGSGSTGTTTTGTTTTATTTADTTTTSGTTTAPSVSNPSGKVTMAQLDRSLVQ